MPARRASSTSTRCRWQWYRLQADKFIVCAGGHARRLPFPGAEHALTHSDVWSLKTLPKSIVIVGGAATGSQLASIFAAFGSQVTLLDLAPRLMPLEDELVSQTIRAAFEQRGVQVITGIGGIDRIEQTDRTYTLHYQHHDQRRNRSRRDRAGGGLARQYRVA